MSLSNFIQAIAKGGGMSMTNGYDVEFDLPSGLKRRLEGVVGDIGRSDDPTNPGSLIKLLCDEAQLPNVQASTSQLNGRYLGEMQLSYPYAKFYSDFSLTWMCDANMSPLKFVSMWHQYIFDGGDSEYPRTYVNNPLESFKNSTPQDLNRSIRLRYPKDYLSIIRVTKTEKGPAAPNQRGSVQYIMQDAYPYSIDAVPLSYGTSQITRVTANFFYAKHTLAFNKITK